MATLRAISPLDASPLGDYAVSSPDNIGQQLTAARDAATVWAEIPVRQRLQRLMPLRDVLLRETDLIVECIHQTTGKVKTDALLGDLYPILDLLAYYRKQARSILAPHDVATSPLIFPAATARVERKPFGVVAVIAPWNYPFQLALAPLLTALIAGNAVILKPSELALPVGALIVDLLATLDLPPGLVQWVVGGRDVGEWLIDAGPELVFFTGGLQAGRAVMQRAARHPIPVLLELGGKDAMLVFADADCQRAANAALYGAFCNSGQVCVAIERLYVERDCHAHFLALLLDGIAQLHVGAGDDADVGAMTSEHQIAIVKAHYDDALAQGAQASGPLHIDGRFVKPVLLWNVHHGMRILREETFGPLLPVMAFDGEAEAITLANDSEFGLNASVWSRDIAKAERIARQLQVGNWAVNDVIKNIGHPGLPFGGVKRSGFGRYHGAEGLLSMSHPVSGLTNRSRLPREPNWFPYSAATYQSLKAHIDFVHGRGPVWQRLLRNREALMAFREFGSIDLRQYWHNFKTLISKRG